MQSVPALSLSPGDYVISYADSGEDGSSRLRGMFSGDWDPSGDVHRYDIEGADGTPILEVHRRWEQASTLVGQKVDKSIAFKQPNGDLCLLLDKSGIAPTYTFRSGDTEDVLGTCSRSFGIVGEWQLKDSTEEIRATVNQNGWLHVIVPFFRQRTYVVSSGDGDEIGRFRYRGPNGPQIGGGRSTMAVSLIVIKTSLYQ